MVRALVCAVVALLAFGRVAVAQVSIGDGTTTGRPVSLQSIAGALRDQGFQALIEENVAAAPGVAGVIRSGVNGATVLVLPTSCTSDPAAICAVIFSTIYQDPKHAVSDKLMSAMNGKLSFARATQRVSKDGAPGFMLVYTYLCKDLTDPKFASTVMREFGTEITKVLSIYNSAPPAPAAVGG